MDLIRQLYAAGLSSRDILELLPCVYTGSATPDMITRLTASVTASTANCATSPRPATGWTR
ncbi:hypothetical protein [Micromonospora sp. NPDC047527]|uniref:hypothetical protein n=1 Tax=unclassified Micromonospora TaxID=2617518 RepID=UPI0033C4DE69